VLPALLFSAQAAGQLFSLAPEVTRAKAAAQSVFSLHDEQPTIITEPVTPRNGTLRAQETPLLGSSASYGTFAVKGELEFRGVSLHYDSRPDVPALDNVSFQIRQGEYVAFVGRSGRWLRFLRIKPRADHLLPTPRRRKVIINPLDRTILRSDGGPSLPGR
jgi:ATP-binding cassette subfamily B (MDR/TAP) protein 1